MALKVYKVSFADNYSTEIKSKFDLTPEFLKSELEKISSIEVKQVLKLEDSMKFDIESKKDIYFSVDFDYMGFPMYYNRILIPKVKDTIDSFNVEEKMRTFVNNVYGTDVKIPSIKFS